MSNIIWKKAYTHEANTGYSLFVDGIDTRAVIEPPLQSNMDEVLLESLNDPFYHLTPKQVEQAIKESKKLS